MPQFENWGHYIIDSFWPKKAMKILFAEIFVYCMVNSNGHKYGFFSGYFVCVDPTCRRRNLVLFCYIHKVATISQPAIFYGSAYFPYSLLIKTHLHIVNVGWGQQKSVCNTSKNVFCFFEISRPNHTICMLWTTTLCYQHRQCQVTLQSTVFNGELRDTKVTKRISEEYRAE